MSDIWKYFEKIAGDKARCKIQSCKKEVCRKQGSTKGMWVHLERQHREEFNKLKDIGSDGQKEKQQDTILNYVAPKNVVNEQEEAEEQLARVMIRQNASFYFFDDSDLMALFVKAFPNIKPHGREHFRRVVIPRMASKIRRHIKEIIGTSFYAITADGWSQPTKSPQLQSITMHCLDENFCRHDMVLATLCMDGLRHSGENIAERITECLAKNDFALNKIACCVRDDARNMQSAAKELDTESFQCVAHFLHLCVNDALKIDYVAEIISKVQEWTIICRTINGRAILKRHQEMHNLTPKKLVMCVPTRWNSVYRMLLAFLKQKKALLSMELERSQRKAGIISQPKRSRLQGMDTISSELPHISATDFELLRHICPILKIFDTETKKFSREKSTASSIIPTLKRMKDFLKRKDMFPEKLQWFVSSLADAISDRMKKIIENRILRIATLLDPRFAYDEELWTKGRWGHIEEQLIDFAIEMMKPCEGDTNNNEETFSSAAIADLSMDYELDLDEAEKSDESIKYDIWKKIPETTLMPSTISGDFHKALSTRLQLQLASFKAIDHPAPDADIFDWWRSNAAQFPDLAQLARILHSIPATSICSERLFSKAGLIYANTLRNRLSAEMVDKILVIKANLDTVYLAPSTEPDPEEMIIENEDE